MNESEPTTKANPPSGKEEAAAGAHERQEHLAQMCRSERDNWPRKALLLFAIKEGGDYKLLGYNSFAEWLTAMDLGLSVSYANTLISAYKLFVVEHGVELDALADVDPTKVRVVMPYVRRGEADPEQALADCVLPRSDLKLRYAGPPEEPEWCECPVCSHRHPSKKGAQDA